MCRPFIISVDSAFNKIIIPDINPKQIIRLTKTKQRIFKTEHENIGGCPGSKCLQPC